MKRTFLQITLMLALAMALVAVPPTSAGHATTGTKVCYKRGIDKITARGITCRRAKRVIGRAQHDWYYSPGTPASIQVGAFKCRFPNEDLSFVVCRHEDAPRRRWAKWFSE